MTTENKGSVDYAAVLADLHAKKTELENLIKGIEAISGMAHTAVGTLAPRRESGTSASIKDDSFFNMTVIDATKKYLAMVHTPKSTQEIIDALQRGGLPTVYNTASSLISRRASGPGDILKVGRSKWGLAEWYPASNRKKKAKDEPDGSDGDVDIKTN